MTNDSLEQKKKPKADESRNLQSKWLSMRHYKYLVYNLHLKGVRFPPLKVNFLTLLTSPRGCFLSTTTHIMMERSSQQPWHDMTCFPKKQFCSPALYLEILIHQPWQPAGAEFYVVSTKLTIMMHQLVQAILLLPGRLCLVRTCNSTMSCCDRTTGSQPRGHVTV